MKKKFYEITFESSSGLTERTFLVHARTPFSAIKKAKRKALTDFFYPIGKVLSVKEVQILDIVR